MAFNLSQTPVIGGMPAAGTLSRGYVRFTAKALENPGKLRVTIELVPNKWLVDRIWAYDDPTKAEGRNWMLNDMGAILEAAGETVVGNPAYENLATIQDVMRALNGKLCAVEINHWGNPVKAGVFRFLSPNPIRGTKEKWDLLQAGATSVPAAGTSAPTTPTTPAQSSAPRTPNI